MPEQKIIDVPLDHPNLDAFAEAINSEAKPIKVEMIGGNYLPYGNCYWNVAASVAQFGGESILGWELKYWPDRFIVARHHAVWKTVDGFHFDVTNQCEEGTFSDYCVFLPDPRITVDLSGPDIIESRYYPLEKSKRVQRFIEAYKKLNDIERRQSIDLHKIGYRREGNMMNAGLVSLTDVDLARINKMMLPTYNRYKKAVDNAHREWDLRSKAL